MFPIGDDREAGGGPPLTVDPALSTSPDSHRRSADRRDAIEQRQQSERTRKQKDKRSLGERGMCRAQCSR